MEKDDLVWNALLVRSHFRAKKKKSKSTFSLCPEEYAILVSRYLALTVVTLAYMGGGGGGGRRYGRSMTSCR